MTTLLNENLHFFKRQFNLSLSQIQIKIIYFLIITDLILEQQLMQESLHKKSPIIPNENQL